MAEQSPDRWQSFVTRLPEQYRDRPEEFVTAWEERQREADAARAEADRYKTWYEREALPWAQQVQPQLEELQRLKRQGQLPASGTTSPTPSAPASIDWDDPDAPKLAYEATVHRLETLAQEERTARAALQQEFGQARESVMGLLGLLEDARRLERDMPEVDITRVAQYAAEQGIRDLRVAANQVYGESRTKQQIDSAVAQARKQWEQEQQTRDIHTERGPGVPSSHVGVFRRGSGPETSRGGSRVERDTALYEALAKKVPDAPWS